MNYSRLPQNMSRERNMHLVSAWDKIMIFTNSQCKANSFSFFYRPSKLKCIYIESKNIPNPHLPVPPASEGARRRSLEKGDFGSLARTRVLSKEAETNGKYSVSIRGCSFFTLHTRPEYFDSGYETFSRASRWVMKHFGGQSGGLWNILDHETFNDYPGNRGHETFSLCPIRAMKLNGVAL